jgi:hypothetical protein
MCGFGKVQSPRGAAMRCIVCKHTWDPWIDVTFAASDIYGSSCDRSAIMEEVECAAWAFANVGHAIQRGLARASRWHDEAPAIQRAREAFVQGESV